MCRAAGADVEQKSLGAEASRGIGRAKSADHRRWSLTLAGKMAAREPRNLTKEAESCALEVWSATGDEKSAIDERPWCIGGARRVTNVALTIRANLRNGYALLEYVRIAS